MYSDELTKKEKVIFKMLCLEGLSFSEIAKKSYVEETTVKTHITNICQKLQFFGQNRLRQMIVSFWKGVLKKMNCSKCRYNLSGKCSCPESYFFKDEVNSEMICNKYSEEEDIKNE